MRNPLPPLDAGGSLPQRIATSLRKAILDGCFYPGEKLDLDQIATAYGVSRIPVREAARTLESRGFVEIRPYRGAFVPVISRQTVREIFGVRRILEPEVAREVTLLLPESVIDELDHTTEEALAQIGAGQHDHFHPDDLRFHETLFDFIENKVLREIMDGLHDRSTLVRRYANLRPGSHMVESLAEHKAILQAIRERDADGAFEAMRTHIENSIDRVSDLISPST